MFQITTTGSLYKAIGAASVLFDDLAANTQYLFTCSSDCFIKQAPSGSPTASAANDCSLIKAGQPVIIHSGNGIKLAIIQASATGHATLVPVTIVR